MANISPYGEVILGELDFNDEENPERLGSFKDDYDLVGFGGDFSFENVAINLSSSDFDTYLQLIDADTGEVINEDDDGGKNFSSQLNFSASSSRNYIVRVTSSYFGEIGDYTLVSGDPSNFLDTDLVISAGVSAPSTVAASETFGISWSVQNIGDNRLLGEDVWSSVYLSEDDTFDFSDRLLRSSFRGSDPSLGPGESYDYQSSILIPEDEVGERYLIFRADTFDEHSETNEDNNFRAIPITVDPPISGSPNLTITANAPSTGNINDPLDFSWTVENQGDARAAAFWYDYVYLSTDETLDSSDIFLDIENAQINSPLDPGENYTVSGSSFRGVPDDLGLGDHFLLFVADRFNGQPESDETDNVYVHPFSVTGVDLEFASEPVVPTAIARGERADISWTVTNSGNGDTVSNSWQDKVYLSSNSTFEPFDIPIITRTIDNDPTLAAGDSYTITQQNITSISSTPGTYYLVFETNSNSAQSEVDSSNNSRVVPIVVTDPNLTITGQDVPTSASVGEILSLNWTTENNGIVSAFSNWQDRVYLSADDVLDDGDITLSSGIFSDNPLAAGQSYNRTQDVTIPIDAVGDYYLLFATDSAAAQFETDETDNVFAAPITIDDNGPDLTIDGVDVPSTALINAPLDLTWRVTNQGGIDAIADWSDQIYLSVDQVVDGADINLGQLTTGDNTPLGGGASYDQTLGVTIPTLAVGDYHLLFKTDSGESQIETDEGNNIAVVPIQLVAPNLVVTDSVGAPDTASVFETIDLTWTVQNQGDGVAVSNWTDTVYLSSDSTLDPTDTLLATQSISNPAPLTVDGTYSRTIQAQLPIDTVGDYFLLFNADRNNTQIEGDNSDNLRAVPIEIDNNGPNLAIDVDLAPSSALLGETVPLAWTVTNAGGITAAADWVDRVYLSEDATLDAADQLLTTANAATSPLEPGASYSQTFDFTVPVTDVGDRYLLFVTDADEAQPETDASDNVYAHAITLDALDVDLVVSDISTAAEVIAGQSVEVRWTITNQGTEAATGPWTDAVYFSSDGAIGNDTFAGFFSFNGTLGPGQSIERIQQISVPANLEGNVQVVVQTDAGAQLLEYGAEDNNSAIDDQSLTITPSPLPNLEVASVTPPPNAFSSKEAKVTWTITNTGNGAASEWYDQVWLSLEPRTEVHPNGRPLSTDIYLGQVENASFLNPGESYSNSLWFRHSRVRIPSFALISAFGLLN